MSRIRFPYSDTHVVLELPRSLPVRLLVPGKAGLPADPAGEITRALRNPVGTGPLPELAQTKKSAVIMVSDQTRLAPTHLFLPYLIEEIVKGGIRKENITVVVGVGAHREASAAEVLSIVGHEVYSTVLCLSSSPSPEKCVVLGKTSRGTPIQIFRQVAEGDLKVATGNIEPHWMAAYSGGAKALVPGVAGLETIEKNPSLSVKGQAVRDPNQNAVRADAEEAAEQLGLDFIFNVVPDHRGRLVQALPAILSERTGPVVSWREALLCFHRTACGHSPGFGRRISQDQSLYQAVKALQNTAAVVKPGDHCSGCQLQGRVRERNIPPLGRPGPRRGRAPGALCPGIRPGCAQGCPGRRDYEEMQGVPGFGSLSQNLRTTAFSNLPQYAAGF